MYLVLAKHTQFHFQFEQIFFYLKYIQFYLKYYSNIHNHNYICRIVSIKAQFSSYQRLVAQDQNLLEVKFYNLKVLTNLPSLQFLFNFCFPSEICESEANLKQYFLTQLVQAKSFDKETIKTQDGELHGRRGRRERGRRTVRR